MDSGEAMFESIKFIFTHFNDETLIISSIILVGVFSLFIFFWLYNRRKFHTFAHHVPADIVKSYLDSIIQDSTTLKSSLSRGGGLELGPGVNLRGSGGDVSSDVLNQKNAELASLQSLVNDKSKIISELENKISDLRSAAPGDNADEIEQLEKENKDLKAEISRLKSELESKPVAEDSGGGVPEEQYNAVVKERDELKEKLQQYEIIEDDLANLKKLQTENEDLKKQLAAAGTAPAAAAAAAPPPAAEPPPPEPAPAAEAAPPPPPPEPEPAAPPPPAAEEAAASDVPENLEGEEKSAEDLLSEFEKMLG